MKGMKESIWNILYFEVYFIMDRKNTLVLSFMNFINLNHILNSIKKANLSLYIVCSRNV